MLLSCSLLRSATSDSWRKLFLAAISAGFASGSAKTFIVMACVTERAQSWSARQGGLPIRPHLSTAYRIATDLFWDQFPRVTCRCGGTHRRVHPRLALPPFSPL